MSDALIPPCDPEAEAAVLGSILIEPDCFDSVYRIIDTPDMFFSDPSFQALFRAMIVLRGRGEPIDAVTVYDAMGPRTPDRYAVIGDAMHALVSVAVSATNVEYYAGIVRQKAMRRRAMSLSVDLREASVSGNGQLDAVLAKLHELQAEAVGGGVTVETTSVADLLAEPDEDVRWIVRDLLPAGGLSMLAAKPKVGKSTLARCMALAVARSEPFLGLTCAGGPVLYCGLEDKRPATADHFRRMGADDEPIHVVTAQPASGSNAAAVATIGVAIEQTGAVLCIIDTLARLVDVEDLNDYSQVQRAVGPILDLSRASQCHIMLLHHCSKSDRADGDSILGSTALFGIVDVVMTMKRDSDGQRTLSTVARYGEDMEPTIVRMDDETGEVCGAGTVIEAVTAGIEAEIVAALTDAGQPLTRSAVRAAIGGQRGAVYRVLAGMVRKGAVERSGSGKKGDPYCFRLLFPRSVLSDDGLAYLAR